MQTLLTIQQKDLDSEAQEFNSTNHRTREAARAVLIDDVGYVFLLNVTKFGYHKLPGGGIDDGEEITAALARELMEEVGCEANIIAELGQVKEFRNYENLEQTSYCFLARKVGEQVSSSLEPGELEEGMVEVKAESIEAAIKLLGSDQPNNLEGHFIQKRDLAFLNAALLHNDN